MRTIQIKPSKIALDHAQNFSRSGRPHIPAAVEALADLFSAEGQRTPIEVYPLAWEPDEEHVDTPEARERGYTRRASKFAVDGYGLIAGYRRVMAGLLLEGRAAEGLDVGLWDGTLSAVVAPAGLTRLEIQNRNLSENTEREALTPMDEALVLSDLTRQPEDGGRGEEIELAARRLRLRGGVPRARKLLKLLGLIDEAREQVRLHHYDPDCGLTVDAAVRLASRSAEEQRRVIAAAKDSAERVTPKGIRSVMAPHQGRQGQPPAPTGARLVRLSARLDKLKDDEAGLKATKLGEVMSPREIGLLAEFAKWLRDEPCDLPRQLQRILKAAAEATS